MSEWSQGPGWWRASDGRWYPPPAAPPSGGRPLSRAQAKELYLRGDRADDVMAAVRPSPPPAVPAPVPGSTAADPGSPLAAPPAPTYGAMAPVETNPMAITSLVLAIVGLSACFGVLAPLAIPFGHVALRQIARSRGRQQGRGLAIAGLVLGYLALAAWVVLAIVIAAIPDAGDSGY